MAAFIRRAMKWGQPLKNILTDYVEVSKDVFTESKANPAKSIIFVILCGMVSVCVKRCPDFNSFKKELIECSNELGLCPEVIRNDQTKSCIDRITALLNNGCIRHLNLGVFSLMIQRPHSSKCCNYHEVCKHLQPRFYQQIEVIDIGVWNKWLILNKTMVNFDVNDSEFPSREN